MGERSVVIMSKTLQLDIREKFLNKDNCILEARMLVNAKRVDMVIQECAEEIYAHTVAYYSAKSLEKLNIKCDWLTRHADPIDLEDGGDKPLRKVVYKLIWNVIPSR